MGDLVVTIGEGGVPIVRSAEEAAALGSVIGSQAQADAAARDVRRRKMFDTPEDAALTFVEGVVDAASLGYIRETGEEADIRRAENAGWSTAGMAAGTVGSLMFGGPAKALAHGAESFGKGAAKALLRAGDKALLTTAAGEAAAGAALAGATAFGHQLMDSVIEDREFSSEAILHEAKLGGLLGGGAGALLGVFGKLGSRAEAAAQGGMLGDVSTTARAIDDSLKAYDEAFDFYKKQYGALEGMRDMDRLGPVSDGFMDVRKAALQRAERASAALRKFDPEVALSGADDAAHLAYRKAANEYVSALRETDELMRASWAEASQAAERGEVTRIELNPMGKNAGDLQDLAARMHGYEADALAKADAEMAAGERMGTPSANPNAGTNPGTPQAIAAKAPVGAEQSASQVMDAIGAAKAGAEASDIIEYVGGFGRKLRRPVARWSKDPLSGEDVAWVKYEHGEEPILDYKRVIQSDGATQVDPYMADFMKRERMGANMRQSAPLRERAAQRIAPSEAAQPAPLDTVVEALPAGQAAKALEDAAQKETTKIYNVDRAATQVGPVPTDFRIEDWMTTAQPGRTRPIHKADARALGILENLRTQAGGRMESAGGLGLVKNPAPAGDVIGGYMDQLVSMRKASRLAADEGRGVASPLRDAMKEMLGSAAVSKLVGSKALGLMAGFAGYGGRLASATGRLAQKASASVAKFMSSNRIRAGVVAATNYPHAYSERGPIADPVERIQEIQHLASNPEAIRARVRETAGDLVKVAPDLVAALEGRAIAQMQRLSVRAPAIFFDKLGRPLSPPAGKMREFFEYENGIHDLDGLLDGIAKGFLTKPQVAALQDGWGSMHVKLATAFLADPEQLQKLTREKLRVVEQLTGVPLTGASDPFFLARQAQSWVPPAPPAAPQKPQAFNINPTGAPTPAQSNATGRAPGN